MLYRTLDTKAEGIFVVVADTLDVEGGRIMSQAEIPLSILRKSKSYRSEQYEWANKPRKQNITQLDGVVIVSFFLPVILQKDPSTGAWSASWDYENILSFETKLRVSWVGYVRHDEITSVEDQRDVAAALVPLNCFPVFISRKMSFDFYDVFCKQTLWPVLHHVAGVYSPVNDQDLSAHREAKLWQNYMQVPH